MSKWISVKNRLPEMYTFVLVFANNPGTDEPKPVSLARYNGNIWEFVNHSPCMPNYGSWKDIEYNLDSDDVTHWMPLPETPK